MTTYQLTLTTDQINAVSNAVSAAMHKWSKTKTDAEALTTDDREVKVSQADEQHRMYCALLTMLNNATPTGRT